MHCPKCASEFEDLEVAGLAGGRCTGCGGIWLDLQGREAVLRLGDAVGIDTGDRRLGQVHNARRGVTCPRCAAAMLRMADSVQMHVEFDSCPVCFLAYFDAGELRDLGDFTLIERLRYWLERWLAIR